MSRTRTLTTGVAVAALLLAAVPAGAATDTFAAEASSAGVTLSLAGNEVLDVGSTFAAAIPGEAVAIATPAAIAGTPLGEREAASDGPLVTDPADAGDRCLLAVPGPFDALVGAGLACADAIAEGDVPAAAAAAGVAELELLDLDGDQLAPLFGLLAQLPLDEVLGPVEAELLGPLGDAFDEAVDRCVDALSAGGILEPVLGPIREAAPAEIGALLDALGGLLPAACETVGDVVDLLTGELIGSITSGDILGQLAGADGVVSVGLLETESIALRDEEGVLAEAGPEDGGAVSLTVDVPLLEELLGDLLTDVLGPVLAEVQAVLTEVGAGVGDVPAVGPLVAGLLASGDVGAVLDGPLLSVAVAPGSASAEGDLASRETGGDADPALVELGGSLLALPVLSGLDDALDAAAGLLDDALLAQLRGSPLAALVDVELLPASVDDGEVGGLPGTVATSGTASVQVLGAVAGAAGGPLVGLEVAVAAAGVGLGEDDGTAPPPPPPPVTPAGPDPDPAPVTPTPTRGNLPVTGGGAALLGLASLGLAATLRRRD